MADFFWQLKDKYVLISGRFVGIDAYEEYKKTFYVTINPVCRKGEMVPVTIHHGVTCYEYEDGNTYSYDCGWDETVWVLQCSSCEVSVSECRGEADAELERLANTVDTSETYKATRQDVNDINEGTKDGEPIIEVAYSDMDIDKGHSEPSDANSSTVWRTVTLTYTYNLTPAWIDPITGKVKYENALDGDPVTEEDKSTYIKVPEMYITRNGKRIRVGQYFVPLNAKSTDLLKYNLEPRLTRKDGSGTREPISEAMCLALIDKYRNKTNNGEYWANFLAFKNSGKPMYPTIQTATDAERQVKSDHGCRMGLYVAFKIQQDFYNEVKGKLNGYNFYYRPIDYSAPFPNGMTANGYWYGVYDYKSNSTKVVNSKGEIDKNNSKDLDESYKEITYQTNNDYNVNTIRNYNSGSNNDRIYSSWSGMNISGVSSFITGNYGVSRNGCQSFYSLGCGPANADWNQCKVTEVCR